MYGVHTAISLIPYVHVGMYGVLWVCGIFPVLGSSCLGCPEGRGGTPLH